MTWYSTWDQFIPRTVEKPIYAMKWIFVNIINSGYFSTNIRKGSILEWMSWAVFLSNLDQVKHSAPFRNLQSEAVWRCSSWAEVDSVLNSKCNSYVCHPNSAMRYKQIGNRACRQWYDEKSLNKTLKSRLK